MIAQTTDISPWSQFGLAGLVIGALFFALLVIIRWMVAHIDKTNERHAMERAEWRQAGDKMVDRIEHAMVAINEAIKELIITVRDHK